MYAEHVKHINIWFCCYLLFTVQIKALSEHVKHIKVYNFLNNGLICNLLAFLVTPASEQSDLSSLYGVWLFACRQRTQFQVLTLDGSQY